MGVLGYEHYRGSEDDERHEVPSEESGTGFLGPWRRGVVAHVVVLPANVRFTSKVLSSAWPDS